MFAYSELTSRNWGLITPEDQIKIKKSTVLFAGCGLGSNIAILAARTGFTSFILADGDNVEISNLNRQTFNLEQIGKNKAKATAKLISAINPEATIKTLPHFITGKEAPDLVNEADFIINTVDPGPALFSLNSAAREKNKVVFFPMNIGYGGLMFVFTAQSATLEEIVGEGVPENQVLFKLIERTTGNIPHIASYIQKFANRIGEILDGTLPAPQLGISANINSSIVVTGMLKSITGTTLALAPEPLYLDTWLE